MRSAGSPGRPDSWSDLDLNEPARPNVEPRARRHHGRRVILRQDRGTVPFEPDGDRFAVEHGDLRPSVIEQDPPTADSRGYLRARRREDDAARHPNHQTNSDEFDPFLPRGIPVPPAVLSAECASEVAANGDVDLVALSAIPQVDARLDHRLAGRVAFLPQCSDGPRPECADRFLDHGPRTVQGADDGPAIFQ